MTIETMLIGIIVLLAGVVIGGAGGQALIRRTLGNTGQSDNGVVTATAATASAAATAAASLNNHVSHLEEAIAKQWDALNDIRQQQTEIATAFKQFPETCKLRHEAIDHEQQRMQAEIDILNTKV